MVPGGAVSQVGSFPNAGRVGLTHFPAPDRAKRDPGHRPDVIRGTRDLWRMPDGVVTLCCSVGCWH